MALRDIIAEFEVLYLRAYLDALDDITRAIDFDRAMTLWEAGDIEGAVRAFNIEESAFSPLDPVYRQTFSAGAQQTMAIFPTLEPSPISDPVVPRVDAGRASFRAWPEQRYAQFVTGITEEQRNNIRQALLQAPRETDPEFLIESLAGRRNKATQNRQGGIIGLSRQYAEALGRADSELRSNDPIEMRKYLKRKRRDKRFDGSVRQAIRAEEPIPEAKIRRMISRYSSRLVDSRARTIAQSETNAATHAGAAQSVQQLIDDGAILPSQVRKTWNARFMNTRDSHEALHGEVASFDEAFESPVTSNRLMHPGDSSLGAGPEDTVNCQCWLTYRFDKRPNILGG